MKKLYVVRIVLFPHNRQGNEGMLVECLRYAGIVKVVRDNERALVFDLFPPKSSFSMSQEWAKMNADRIKTFGINAECCPASQEAPSDLS